MSDEPLIFEHTSDEPEQNGFPLDTADLPLDSVDHLIQKRMSTSCWI